jgi:hypothetical protein
MGQCLTFTIFQWYVTCMPTCNTLYGPKQLVLPGIGVGACMMYQRMFLSGVHMPTMPLCLPVCTAHYATVFACLHRIPRRQSAGRRGEAKNAPHVIASPH